MAEFEKISRTGMVKSMLKVDIKRLFTTPLIYIMAGVSLVMPVLILVMTTMMTGTDGGEAAADTFTNVWQAIGNLSSDSAAAMSLTSMCNINLIYFLAGVFVCIFIADDFRSGYAKNIFTVRPCKYDYVISKTSAGFAGGALMLVCYLLGAVIGGGIAGLSFSAGEAGAGGIAACIISKIFLMLVFIAIFTVMSVAAKRRLWLSILLSLGASMLLYTMISIIAPLDSGVINVIMCIVGGGIFAAGLGAVSVVILNKTALA